MAASLDITVLPIYRQEGFDQSHLPGLNVASPPRRAARGRRKDRLIIFVSFEGRARLSPSQYSQVLGSLEKGYYQTPGTATTALRSLAASLNDFLLKRNLGGSGRGGQVIGMLTLAVVRENRLYLAQSGAVHGFLLTPDGIRHLYDPKEAGRGLGLSRQTSVRFFQAELSPGTKLVLAPKISPGWNEKTLQGAYGQKLAALRRRLLADAGADLTAVIVQAHTGSGQIRIVHSKEKLEAPSGDKQELKEIQKPVSTQPVQPPFQDESGSEAWESVDVPVPETVAEILEDLVDERPPPQAIRRSDPPKKTASIPEIGPTVKKGVVRLSSIFSQLFQWLRTFFGRMLPEDSAIKLPASTMAFIAVAIPLVVVTVAALVYLKIGRDTLFDSNFSQAQSVARYAQTLSEPLEIWEAWMSTVYYLDEAEQYHVKDESEALRAQAQSILDELDGVTRLDFLPVVEGTLGGAVNIRRIVSTGDDLYMLNTADGNGEVLLASKTANDQYLIDPEFNCGPGQYGAYIVGPIVDIAGLPRANEENSTLVAMDGNGNLLYCIKDAPALATPLETPDSLWGNPMAMTIENGNLYILDPLTNAVWIYYGDGGIFGGAPRLFFANEIPNDFQGMIDLAIYGDDLFLLHIDGHMIKCTFSDLPEAPTTCDDPTNYIDTRPGRGETVRIPNANFIQMVRAGQLEESLYILDPAAQAIYHFSMQLRLIGQFRSRFPLPEGVTTAFTVSSEQTIFLVVGDEILYTSLSR
ncbi:MAG: hypothetical protein FVQ83_11405 [Chloroflexi bacterium]|nr:hypothetical protein [Chloroflexota bacterium]